MLNIPIAIEKKIITFDVGPIICVSFTSEKKTQVRWANAIG